jgi:tRNA threonylcarbamoyl adenosine modification protein YeaZ
MGLPGDLAGIGAVKMGNPDHSSNPCERVPGEPANPAREAVILAVETSSRVGSAALALGPKLLEESRFSGPMQHGTEMFPAIDGLLKGHGYAPTDIGQIHIAIGPGSFTGLRIAVTMAKAMHLANAVQIVTVDSLDVVAANLSDPPGGQIEADGQELGTAIPDRIVALFDAKRGQFYAGVYERVAAGSDGLQKPDNNEPGYRIHGPDNALWQKVVPDGLMTAQEIVESFAGSDRIGLLGDGLFYHRDQFDTDRVFILPERYWSPHAANVHRLGYQKAMGGRFADPWALTPFYLRGPEVTLRKKP